MSLRSLVLLICIVTEPILLHAQEPRTPIKPADPVSAASHEVTVMGGEGDKPVILPAPLPRLKVSLGEYARQVRAAHGTLRRAVRVVNDDAPIVVEEVVLIEEKQ
jgi:hypothetical protein